MWGGAFLLLTILIYGWTKDDLENKESNLWVSVPKNIFVDQLLLSAADLRLEESASLINITLNKDMNMNPVTIQQDSIIRKATDRKLIYSKILKQKINKISPSNSTNIDFEIKPLPK